MSTTICLIRRISVLVLDVVPVLDLELESRTRVSTPNAIPIAIPIPIAIAIPIPIPIAIAIPIPMAKADRNDQYTARTRSRRVSASEAATLQVGPPGSPKVSQGPSGCRAPSTR